MFKRSPICTLYQVTWKQTPSLAVRALLRLVAIQHHISLLVLFHIVSRRQNKPDRPFETITKHVCFFCRRATGAPSPRRVLLPLAAAANATGAMQHGEVCATA